MTIELACEAGIGCAAERIFSVITDLRGQGPNSTHVRRVCSLTLPAHLTPVFG